MDVVLPIAILIEIIRLQHISCICLQLLLPKITLELPQRKKNKFTSGEYGNASPTDHNYKPKFVYIVEFKNLIIIYSVFFHCPDFTRLDWPAFDSSIDDLKVTLKA